MAKTWGKSGEFESAEETPKHEPEAVAPQPASAHVHEWTQISERKRKCKPCGAVEVSE